MKKLLLGMTVLAALGVATVVHADPYGTAGCGLGAMIFKAQHGPIQILAATTNNFIVPQTSAITSGTSGCSEMSAHEEASLFITINQEALRKDISRGEGETLVGLSRLLRCSDDGRLGNTLQKSFNTIFPTAKTSGDDVTRSIDSAIQSDESLVKSCKIYG